MNFNRHKDKILLLIPAIVMFFLALIPTINYQWPLSWDIIYHIQYAKIYANYGLVLNNPLINPTQKIGYPPLFHFLLVFLVTLLKIDYFQVAKLLQPIFAASIVLSVSYVAREYYGRIAGVSAGFLFISSYLIHRIILPIPENFALIFLPIAVYFYYRSFKEENIKYALISGLLFVIIISTHLAAPLCLFLVVTAFTITKIALDKDLKVLKSYVTFFIISIVFIIAAVITLYILKPELLNSIIGQGITAVTGYQTSISFNKPMNVIGYLGTLGAMTLIFTVLGFIFSIKKKQERHIFILIWIITMFLLSNVYWLGINVISYRVLIYLLIPLAIFGGYGLSQFYYTLKEYKTFSSLKFRSIFLICIFILCTFFGVLTVTNPKVSTFKATTEFGDVQIAPPTTSEADLAKWFGKNGDKNKSIITNNLYSAMFISSQTLMPFHYGFNINTKTPYSYFRNEKIGYILFDKRLIFPSSNKSTIKKLVNSEFFQLYFYSNRVSRENRDLVPPYARVVYENQDFLVYEVYPPDL